MTAYMSEHVEPGGRVAHEAISSVVRILVLVLY